MTAHGLTSWGVAMDGAKTRAGVCRYTAKQIGLSRYFVLSCSEAELQEIVLHEIAHALVGPGHHHDRDWRRTARLIGCTGQRCYEGESEAPASWQGVCSAGHVATRHRRPSKPLSCAKCSPRVYSLAHEFVWSFHGTPVSREELFPAAPASSTRGTSSGRGRGATSGRKPSPTGRSGPVRRPAAKPVLTLPVGARVRIGGRNRWAGQEGVVAKRGRTRYTVQVGGQLLDVPAALVQAA